MILKKITPGGHYILSFRCQFMQFWAIESESTLSSLHFKIKITKYLFYLVFYSSKIRKDLSEANPNNSRRQTLKSVARLFDPVCGSLFTKSFRAARFNWTLFFPSLRSWSDTFLYMHRVSSIEREMAKVEKEYIIDIYFIHYASSASAENFTALRAPIYILLRRQLLPRQTHAGATTERTPWLRRWQSFPHRRKVAKAFFSWILGRKNLLRMRSNKHCLGFV
jgi:hypothetical protein